MRYDPTSRESRSTLAATLCEALATHGFMEEYAERSGEKVYYRPVDNATGVRLQVWTSVDRATGSIREVGEDAIRVCAVYRNGSDADRGICKTGRVNRVGEINAIVERTVERARGVWRDAQKAPHCTACGAPMFVSKAGNSVCADLCWKKNNRWSS